MITKAAAIARIDEVQERFARECESVSETAWQARPAVGHWSMADVCEHVTVSHENLYKLIAKRVVETPLGAARPDVIDDEIPFLFYRGEEPPNIATPTGRWPKQDDAIAAFRASTKPVLDLANATMVDLRLYGAKHPVFGQLDGVQWLLFMAAHMERHRAQLIGLRRGG